jgi:hypothetical protein
MSDAMARPRPGAPQAGVAGVNAGPRLSRLAEFGRLAWVNDWARQGRDADRARADAIQAERDQALAEKPRHEVETVRHGSESRSC